MDRLSAVMLTFVSRKDAETQSFAPFRLCVGLSLLVACPEPESAPPPSRVQSVTVTAPSSVQLDAFCDVRASATDAKPFAFPPLEGAEPPNVPTWRWVNAWATWCGPCVAEMPMVVRWHDELAARGHAVELTFVSFDEEPSRLEVFKRQHSDMDLRYRLRSKDDLPAWLASQSLDPSTAIPLHFFVDPEGRTRCVRAGAIDPGDRALVEAIVAGG